jgi:TonB-dependent starch-binding outer membrane protein SusC
MRKLYGLLTGLILLCYATAWAQTKEVTGRVTDAADGSPLAGVTVKVKNAPNSTTTGADGSFRLNVPENATAIVFSSIGFTEQEVTISSLMNISLAKQDRVLSEVVVVGYGETVKRNVTGSIAKIGGREVENMPIQSFESALQGKAAGVVVQSGSGRVGQAIKMRIRGTSSISASSQPLYVVDGLPVISNSLSDGANDQTNPLVDINPNDIESIEVLKDASASAIYGARAANGVVLITTKKGKYGRKTSIEVNLNTSFSNPARKFDFLNTAQYAELFRETASNDANALWESGGSPFPTLQETIDAYTGAYEGFIDDFSLGLDWRNGEVDTDWQSLLYNKNANASQADLSFSGGTDKTRFFISGFYNTQEAIVINNKFTRYGGRLNLDHSVTDYLTVGLNVAVNRSQLDRVSTDNAFSTPGQMVAQLPFSPVIDPNTNKTNRNTLYDNGLLDAQFNTDKQVTFRNIGNAFGNLQLASWLQFRTEFGADLFNLYQEAYNGKEGSDGGGIGLGSFIVSQSVTFNTNNYFTISPRISDNHKVSGVLGMSYLNNNTRQATAAAEGYPSDAIKNLSGASEVIAGTSVNSKYTFLSYFLRGNYSFHDKYLFSASVRTDGSSRFGSNNRYGWFPAASVGWIMSEENFLRGSDFLSFLKLRASYGLTGNAEIGESNFLALYGISNYPGLAGFTPIQLGNPDLKWERTNQADIGLDFGILNNRITGEIDYYNKKTEDMLLAVNIPATTGYSTVVRNLGSMENKGFEIVLNSRNIDGRDFKWSTSFNLGYNKNTVTDIQGQVITSGSVQRAVEGHPIGSFFLQRFVGADPQTGEAVYLDVDGKEIFDWDNGARVVVGKANPDFTGGFTNNFSYKGFDLNIFFIFSKGNDVYNSGGIYMSSGWGGGFDNQTTELLDRWQKPGDITRIPKLSLDNPTGIDPSSRWLYDGSYIRLRNVTLGYTLPATVANKLKIASARLFITGMNLWITTKYPGDPEVNTAVLGNIAGGQDFYTIPQPRSITAGINVRL